MGVAAAYRAVELGHARGAGDADVGARSAELLVCGLDVGIVGQRDRDRIFGVRRQIGQPWRRLRVDRRLADEADVGFARSEEHTSELQSLMRISYAVFCLKKKKRTRR